VIEPNRTRSGGFGAHDVGILDVVPADTASLLAPLREEPERSAVLIDVDGTLAPIVDDPDDAAPLPEARDALASLAERFAVVGCVSGRPAEAARRLVGLDGLVYLGNHGLERLEPGAETASGAVGLDGAEDAAARFADGLDGGRLASAGLRLEDKGPIRALHWRGAVDEDAAERAAAAIAADAEAAGLALHRGRKVIELRPSVAFDKGTAISALLADRQVRHALYAGDDRTDVDAFRALHRMAERGDLATAVCVGIASDESPPEVSAEADVVAPDPAGFAAILRELG
jgi:trehalose-phosphatase